MARRILAMDDATYQATYRGSPMKRAKLAGLKRNASIVLANLGIGQD